MRASETLSQIPLFRSLDPEAIRRLDARCSWRHAVAKEWIIEYQDEGTDVFFVAVGFVRVVITNPSGRTVILADIGAGDFFGELAALDGKPRSASILAVTDVTVARMPAAVFKETLHQHSDICDQLLSRLVSRVRSLTERVTEFTTLHASHLIHSELLRLSRPDPSDDQRAIISPPPVHADIAARVSTRRETVARELKALERAGLLFRRRGALVLTDVRRLVETLEVAREGDSAVPTFCSSS